MTSPAAATSAKITRGTLRVYGDDAYPVFYRQARKTTTLRARYPGFQPETRVLRAGTVRREGSKALPCDMIFERDVAMTLRDGTTMYSNVFRPTDATQTYPAIINWGTYGKDYGSLMLDDYPGRAGVPQDALSDLHKFEGADPAYWIAHGYVVVNPDPRGTNMSEGNVTFWGRQMAEDGYDFVEWCATQPWCSGKVTFSGNSMLAASQWFIAAEQPPHLTAIAPWEGLTDIYRHTFTGGIPSIGFCETILKVLPGNNQVEDHSRMLLAEPLMTPYWEDKISQLEKITVPAYIVASYDNPLHTYGSIEAFQRIRSQDKWLRIHNTWEWPDYYTPAHVEDLRAFYDHFLKGIDNGWETTTPRVRSLLFDAGHQDILNIPETQWPPERMESLTLFLENDNTLGTSQPSAASALTYEATGKGGVTFCYKVPKDLDVIGFIKVRLWVEAVGSNDMDLTATISKRLASATTSREAKGSMRVSLRHLDEAKSTAFQPFQSLDRMEHLRPGQIVPVDIGVWPTGMRFHANEVLQLTVAPAEIQPSEYEMGWGTAKVELPVDGGTFIPGDVVEMQSLGGQEPDLYAEAQRVTTPSNPNIGQHKIYFGGDFDSFVLLPVHSV